jgi:hypothetical protein
MGAKKRVRIGRVIQPTKNSCGSNASEKSREPEFKPGDTPWCEYGNEVLNGNVDWVEIVKQVLMRGYNKKSLAQRLELAVKHIETILNGDLSPLNFKRGARLLAIESEVCTAK